jgi:hypothetical protein
MQDKDYNSRATAYALRRRPLFTADLVLSYLGDREAYMSIGRFMFLVQGW